MIGRTPKTEMYSTPKKRRGFESRSLKQNPSSSSSPSSVLGSSMEPPRGLFPSKGELMRLVTVVAIASAVALGCNFMAGFLGSTPTPFCDSSLEPLDSTFDICEPCPENGNCYEGKLECNEGYRKQGKTCVEDGEINQTTRKMLENIEAHVCRLYALNSCYGTGTVWVNENDVLKDLQLDLMRDLDGRSYMYAKGRTMEAVDELLEKRTNPNGMKELKCPDSLVESYKPVSCRINQWIINHILVVVSTCASVLGCALLYRKVRRRRYLSHRIEELYHQVCDILEENALAAKGSVGTESESWVVASRLRDHLLFPRERKDPMLWKKVEELVQEDSRVDRYPKLVKGESKVVWEWQVEGSLSASKLKRRKEAQQFKTVETLNTKNSELKHQLGN